MPYQQDAVSSKPILKGQYKLLKVLQKLPYSTYYLGTSLHNPAKRWAVKEIELVFDSPAHQRKAFMFFESEAHRYLSLKHPHLVALENYFHEKQYQYLVFEYIPGHRLKEIIDLRREPFSESQTADLALKVADGIDYLHSQNIIFFDLNPSNVIITPEGSLKLTDYGLGKIIAKRSHLEPHRGTMGYCPPEQFGREGSMGRNIDVYALGVIMHQMLTFWDPALAMGVVPPVEKLNSSVGREMANLIKNATYKDPALRYPAIRAFLKDLRVFMKIQHKEGRRRTKRWLLDMVRELARPFVGR